MKFSDQFEQRFTEMLTHYPTKRSLLVPTLLFAQDEVGYLSDDVIAEIAGRVVNIYVAKMKVSASIARVVLLNIWCFLPSIPIRYLIIFQTIRAPF